MYKTPALPTRLFINPVNGMKADGLDMWVFHLSFPPLINPPLGFIRRMSVSFRLFIAP